jgi:hypothetical protein
MRACCDARQNIVLASEAANFDESVGSVRGHCEGQAQGNQ